MAQGFPGSVHLYHKAKTLILFEHARNSLLSASHTLLVVGGLGDGLTNLPFIKPLVKFLQPTPWKLCEVQLSSSSLNWGTGNLQRDADELAEAVGFVRKHEPTGKVVILGSSTGCQDILTYLTSQNGQYPLPIVPDYPPINGAVLQAPVSDREAFGHMIFPNGRDSQEADSDKVSAMNRCLQLAREHEQRYPDRTNPENYPQLILPVPDTTTLGFFGTPVTTDRFLSLWGNKPPGPQTADDLFSSDLPDETLARTFGKVGSMGRLKDTAPGGQPRVSILALISGADEYMPPWTDRDELLRRWGKALGEDGVELHPFSGIVEGARHNGAGESESELAGRDGIAKRVVDYLLDLSGPTAASL